MSSFFKKREHGKQQHVDCESVWRRTWTKTPTAGTVLKALDRRYEAASCARLTPTRCGDRPHPTHPPTIPRGHGEAITTRLIMRNPSTPECSNPKLPHFFKKILCLFHMVWRKKFACKHRPSYFFYLFRNFVLPPRYTSYTFTVSLLQHIWKARMQVHFKMHFSTRRRHPAQNLISTALRCNYWLNHNKFAPIRTNITSNLFRYTYDGNKK